MPGSAVARSGGNSPITPGHPLAPELANTPSSSGFAIQNLLTRPGFYEDTDRESKGRDGPGELAAAELKAREDARASPTREVQATGKLGKSATKKPPVTKSAAKPAAKIPQWKVGECVALFDACVAATERQVESQIVDRQAWAVEEYPGKVDEVLRAGLWHAGKPTAE